MSKQRPEPTSLTNTVTPPAPGSAADWTVYIIRCSDQSLYTGISTDAERRFDEHHETHLRQGNKGAKYFYGRAPVTIVYREQHSSRSAASKREAAIKKLSRSKKLQLIASGK
ncbi:putative endonuclease [Sinobacterium caligoides]|uniref:Putative endonuclease n=1 Tax=Sinobacterium caligoides TaxID=933926 RepID=A0A3N2DDX5_9GAMM|nr:GIY-YIG nuclease family protein [Sinobacterium caligoides]ROR97989.1 putative endonuclease [Sinobacterium caligoides]